MSPTTTGSLVNPSPRSSHKKSLDRSEDGDDDRSTISQESGVPRAEHALDALRFVAGNRVRHARCAPEFLEEIATKGAHDNLKRAVPRTFKVVSGSEARSFFRNYLSQHNKPPRHSNDKITNEAMPSPIVFAVTVWDASVKCVDYYMTWRGNKKGRRGKDVERRIEFLDAEFRRLAKKMDDEYKRIQSLRTHDNLSPLRAKFDTKPSSRKPRAPPGITVSNTEEADKVGPLIPALPEPPVSAADSVMSLPLLNMVRGVPFSHRVPLRVTNPDRLSLISEIDIRPALELPAAKLAAKEQHGPLNENHPSSNTLAVPHSHRLSKLAPDGDVKKSSASIRSSDTKSSKSSRSSRSSSRSRLENRENKGSRSSSLDREKHSFKDEEVPEFVIYFLGDKLDRDTTSWHGLERQNSNSIRSLPLDRHSPWIGPLAATETISFRQSPSRTPSDTDSEESGGEGHWKNSPVIPLKPFLEAMGITPQYYRSPPVVPGGKYVSVGSVGSPAPNQSPYLYSSPRLESSPYVPAWLPPLQPSSAPSSRPPSRAYSPASYGSPYMQSHTGPF